jgi:hypothetical protein
MFCPSVSHLSSYTTLIIYETDDCCYSSKWRYLLLWQQFISKNRKNSRNCFLFDNLLCVHRLQVHPNISDNQWYLPVVHRMQPFTNCETSLCRDSLHRETDTLISLSDVLLNVLFKWFVNLHVRWTNFCQEFRYFFVFDGTFIDSTFRKCRLWHRIVFHLFLTSEFTWQLFNTNPFIRDCGWRGYFFYTAL